VVESGAVTLRVGRTGSGRAGRRYRRGSAVAGVEWPHGHSPRTGQWPVVWRTVALSDSLRALRLALVVWPSRRPPAVWQTEKPGWAGARTSVVSNSSTWPCNSRFLILPGIRVPNLASHVLGLAVRRLVRDWPKRYGIALWALETFVAPPRLGTSYRAANWREVGESRGRGRQDGQHTAERTRKRVFLHLIEPRRFPRAGPPAAPETDWAAAEFAGLELDARLQRRTVALARRFQARPTASLPQACEGHLAELRGAYRLFQHEKVTIDTLLAPSLSGHPGTRCPGTAGPGGRRQLGVKLLGLIRPPTGWD
jgi:hypothetical protein